MDTGWTRVSYPSKVLQSLAMSSHLEQQASVVLRGWSGSLWGGAHSCDGPGDPAGVLLGQPTLTEAETPNLP